MLDGVLSKEYRKIQHPENMIVNLFIQAIDALFLMHSAGMAHLDIKPANMLISNDVPGFELNSVLDLKVLDESSDLPEFGSKDFKTMLGNKSSQVDTKTDNKPLTKNTFFSHLHLRIADFGLSTTKDIPYRGPYTSFYFAWPPDFMLYESKRTITDNEGKIKPMMLHLKFNSIKEEYKKEVDRLHINDVNPFNAFGFYSDKASELFNVAEYMYKKDRIEYFKTVDIFSMGIAFITLVGKLGIVLVGEGGVAFKSLLISMIHPSPLMRATHSKIKAVVDKWRKKF